MEALVVGKPNTGKSLFVVNFASYLGLKEVRLEMMDQDGMVRHQKLPLEKARRQLVSHVVHKTQTMQSISVDILTGRHHHVISLTDTVGLTDEIHFENHIRRAMAMALDQLTHTSMVLHLIDASAVGLSRPESLSLMDEAMARYASTIAPYAILANKMDRDLAKVGLDRVRERFRGQAIIPISAMTRRGFRDVKTFILRHWS